MTVRILIGDVREQLRTLPDESVHCVVTSPPYWGLRDYGTARWEGGDPDCDHRSPTMREGRNEQRPALAGSPATNSAQLLLAHRSACGKCGAVKIDDQLGLESTLGEHIAVMVAVFREVRRVLRPEGMLWLNYGDCYATSPNGRSAADTKEFGNDDRTFRDKPFSTVGPIYETGQSDKHIAGRQGRTGNLGNGGLNGVAVPSGRVVAGGYLKPKDLCMVPNRMAIALQEDGWWVRSEIIWGKPNPMPDSSGAYRPSTAHEKIFLLAKSEDADVWRARDTGELSCAPNLAETCPLVTRPDTMAARWVRLGAYYDAAAVALPCSPNTHARLSQDVENQIGSARANGGAKTNVNMKAVGRKKQDGHGRRHDGFNARWDEKERKLAAPGSGTKNNESMDAALAVMPETRYLRNYEPAPLAVWEIATAAFSEAHFATFPPELVQRCVLAGCPFGGTVLDPFFGAGTTGLVAESLGRDCIGIELNPDYATMARRRIRDALGRVTADLPDDKPTDLPLFQEALSA